ncbi:MAG TPA: patatin-like phospholipase family protein, partial [Candidatus Tectomicrobia bacterium]|nr:patatin-like phospholipase family protein [Candidatus Tectomicrobia bacterium]
RRCEDNASAHAMEREEHMRRNRAMIRGFFWLKAGVGLLGALVLTGCASAVAFRVPKAGPETTCVTPAPDRDVLVGVALSGGGSRAALFGAAGLEALARLPAPSGGSVLEQVAYLSSVSGGSVAAAAYASQKPPRETPVLTPEGALTAEYETFFAEYQEKLRQNFESALLWRQLLAFRWLNSSLAARSLAEVMAQRLLGLTTFAELAQREARGDSPRLLINTTLYNSARRLVLTTLPPEASRYDFYADLRASLARRGVTTAFPPAFLQRWEKLLSLTPLELGIDVCPIRLAGAVAGSASFPPLVGPITFHVGDEEIYWHTGDGGLYENQGFESLLFVFLKKLQEQRARRALIIAFDSSFPFAVGERRLTRRSQPFSLWNYDYTRIPSIMEQRASTYQALFLRSLQLEGVFPDDQTIRIVHLRHTDATWQPDLSDLPAACRQADPPLDSPTAVVEHIAEISTRFWLASECDRQLLAVAAAKVVAQHQPEITAFLQGPTAGRAGR